jgi:Flp pilus assembly protein TadB
VSGRGHALVRATNVSATAIALDDTRVLVRLDAQLGGYRSLLAQQNVAITGGGIVVGGVLAVLGFPLIAAAAPAVVFAPAGFALARSSQHRSVERAQLALEQVLDRLERGDAGRPPTLLSMLSAAVRG